jgi:hypothetical protein
MIRIVDGQPVHVPDDARITTEMKDARTAINAYLHWLSQRGPEVLELERKFREGVLSDTDGFEWYLDPVPPSTEKPST